jgi:adenylate cyclase
VNRYDAKIYQYVGDEIVLSWDMHKGIQDNNCIKTFFEYDKLLNRKSDYYKDKFGFVPEFKAGVNSGFVTVAEVGELKKELAYHRDVLNTAARIQVKCNEFKSKLLISEETQKKLIRDMKFHFERIGNIQLKGKEQRVNIYSVTQND